MAKIGFPAEIVKKKWKKGVIQSFIPYIRP
jgi:hypothetical protein